MALTSAALFAVSGPCATSLLRIGWTPGAAVIARLAVAAAVLTVPAVRRLHRRPAIRGRAVASVALYGLVAVAGAQLCYFEAVQDLSVAVALLLEYSGILLVVVWQWGCHRQRPGRSTLAGATAAVVGLALVLDLGGRQHLDPAGVAWGLGAAAGLAVYFVVSSSSSSSSPSSPGTGTGTGTGDGDALSPLVVAWGGLVVGAVSMIVAGIVGVLPVAAPHADVVLAGAHTSWVVPVLGLAILAAALAYVTGIVAARALGPRVASFVGLAEVVFATAYAWVLLDERLTISQVLGGVVLLGGIALVRSDVAEDRPVGDDRTTAIARTSVAAELVS